MPHDRDIDEQTPSERDLLLLDLLYGERDLDEEPPGIPGADAADQDSESDADPDADNLEQDLQSDLEAFSNLRALFRELPDEEPSPAVTTKLLHAAALHAPKAAVADDGEKRGFFAWLAGLFRPIATHPGLAAAASLALIVAVTSTMYMSGNKQPAEPEMPSASTPSRTPAVADESPPTPEANRKEAERVSAETAGDNLDSQLGAVADKNSAATANRNTERSDLTRGASKKKFRRKGKRARTARPYEGKPISKSGAKKDATLDLDDAFNDGLGDRIPSMSNIGAGQAVPAARPEPAPAPPTMAAPADEAQNRREMEEDAKVSVQAQTVSPAPTPGSISRSSGRSIESKAPAKPRKKSSKKKKKNKSKSADSSGTRNRLRSLHDEARTAAANDDCSTVREMGELIASIDPDYYRNTFRRDKKLARCVSDKSR